MAKNLITTCYFENSSLLFGDVILVLFGFVCCNTHDYIRSGYNWTFFLLLWNWLYSTSYYVCIHGKQCLWKRDGQFDLVSKFVALWHTTHCNKRTNVSLTRGICKRTILCVMTNGWLWWLIRSMADYSLTLLLAIGYFYGSFYSSVLSNILLAWIGLVQF